MSDLWVLAVGTVIFISTAWTAFAFGLARFNELARRNDARPQVVSSRDPS